MEDILEYKLAFSEEVSSSLNHIPVGEVWTKEEIELRKRSLILQGRKWEIVFNLPLHEEIKHGYGAPQKYINSYIQSLYNLAHSGIKTVKYNFSPIFYNLCTQWEYCQETQSLLPIVDPVAFALFDIHILNRVGARKCYNDYLQHSAMLFNRRLSVHEKAELSNNILGCVQDQRIANPESLLSIINTYTKSDFQRRTANFILFQSSVLPVAGQLGIEMILEKQETSFRAFNIPNFC